MPWQSISHLPKQHEHMPHWLKNQAINPPSEGWLSPWRSEHKLLALSVRGSFAHPAGLRNTFPGLSHPPTIYVPYTNVVAAAVASGRMGSTRLRLRGFGRLQRDRQAQYCCELNGCFSLFCSQLVPTTGKALGAAGAAPLAGVSLCRVGVGLCARAGAGRWVMLSKQPGAATEPLCRDTFTTQALHNPLH